LEWIEKNTSHIEQIGGVSFQLGDAKKQWENKGGFLHFPFGGHIQSGRSNNAFHKKKER